MKILLLSIGKTKEKYLRRGIEEYLGRLKHYCNFEYQEWTSNKTKGSLAQVLESESDWILKQINPQDHLILLDEHGQEYTSRKFARKLEHWLMHTQGRLIFVIGGAYGFTDALKKQSHGLLSLSKMTFSHQLVRLIFVEQLFIFN